MVIRKPALLNLRKHITVFNISRKMKGKRILR